MTATASGIAPATTTTAGPAIEITGHQGERYDEILTAEAVAFITELHHRFAGRRHDRLADRMRRRFEIGNGHDPRFSDESRAIREDDTWQVAGAGPGLEDRRVEITGSTDPATTIAALNSGAKVWLADHEDALSPTWANIIGGQITLCDAIRGQLRYTDAEGATHEVTATERPTIVFRPRGWHLVEKHVRFTDRLGRTMDASASLTDFGLYFFHNAKALIEGGAGPYFYLPKIESADEAALWDDVFSFSEEYLGIPHGTIRATVHIETLPAAFQMDEILYELRDHASGLNAARWDYIFSFIKNYRGRGARFVLPDRNEVTMTVPFMRAYTELLVKTCHRRGAHAIGGMSAFAPNPSDPEATERNFARVTEDKKREASEGFDGTWVAHPALVPVARAEFDAVLGEQPNQLGTQRDDVQVTSAQLLDTRIGLAITDRGVHHNVSFAIRYIESWLRGEGAAHIDGIIADASTAEISRSQLWQWIHQDRETEEGNLISRAFVEGVIEQVLEAAERHEGDRFDDAAEVFREVALREEFPTFLTIGAYAKYLVDAD